MFEPPKAGDKAFSPKGELPIDVAWHRFMSDNNQYASAFVSGANMLVDALANDPTYRVKGDLFLPVCYLYRHSIELRLKTIIWRAQSVDYSNWTLNDLSTTHSLHVLWNEVRVILEKLEDRFTPDVINALEQLVLEFHHVDPESQQFRYPYVKVKKDKKKTITPRGHQLESSLQMLPDEFSMANLKVMMDKIDTVLSYASQLLDILFDIAAEQYRDGY